MLFTLISSSMIDSSKYFSLRLRRFVVITTLPALCLFGAAAYTQEDMEVIVAGDGNTALTSDSSHEFSSVLLDSDALTSRFDFEVIRADIGKIAGLYLVARYQDQWFQRSNATWLPWDGSIASLKPFVSSFLNSTTSFDIFDEQQLPAGDYQIYAAYRVHDGPLVVASSNVKFQVDAANKDRLHRFESDTAMASYLKQAMHRTTNDNRVLALPAVPEFAVDATTADSGGESTSSRVSGTNVQEQGVDEADVIKTNGSHLFALRSCDVPICIAAYSLDASQASATEVGNYQSESESENTFSSTDGMYLINDGAQSTLVTLGSSNSFPSNWYDIWAWSQGSTELEFINASDPAQMSMKESISLDGTLISSRRVGDTLHLVTRYSPALEGFQPYPFEENQVSENEVILEQATLSDLIPRVRYSNREELDLVTSNECYLPTSAVDVANNPSIITITSVPLSDPQSFSSTCYLGNSETVYMTTRSLYLATTQYDYSFVSENELVYNPEHSTAIHKFALQGGGVDYRGSGEVQGHLGWSEDKRSFRMGENGAAGEYLNVVTSVGETWNETSSTRLSVLKEQQGQLQNLKHIDGIGKPGEQLYAARFLGDKAYLVTFRVIDPLYVVDLSDQENPVIAGELEIDGYSDYLHPVSENLLLGIGKDAVPDDGSSDFGFTRGAWYQGVKLSLFDVSNPSAPNEINSIIFGKRGSESEVLYDHHAISFLPATEQSAARIAIPISIHESESGFDRLETSHPSTWYGFTRKGLYSFEASAEGLIEVGSIGANVSAESENEFGFGSFSRYGDRSVLVDDAVYYVNQGEVLSSFWGQEQ